MCDMRGSPTQAIVKSTGEIIDLKYCGNINNGLSEFGIYHVGGSGCGYCHYYGELSTRFNLDTIGPWENEQYKYGNNGKFGREGSEQSRINILSDWKDFKLGEIKL